MTYRSASHRARVFDDALREAMDATVTQGDDVEVAPSATPAAGAHRPEADAAKTKGDGGIVDSDPHGAYGDGVEDAHTLDGLSGGHKSRLHSLTPSAESVPMSTDFPGQPFGPGDTITVAELESRESARLARLRLWQAQR